MPSAGKTARTHSTCRWDSKLCNDSRETMEKSNPETVCSSIILNDRSALINEIMCQGKEKLQYYIDDYNRRSATLSKKEQDTMKDMKIVQEMYARGFEFMPIDIFRAKANHFQVVDGKLMPALSTIDGMGGKAAEGVVEAAKHGPFSSRENFKLRAKISGTVVEKMAEMGILGDLPETDQMSLLDFMA